MPLTVSKLNMKIIEPFARDKPPLGLRWRSSNWFTVFVVTFAVFTDVRFMKSIGN